MTLLLDAVYLQLSFSIIVMTVSGHHTCKPIIGHHFNWTAHNLLFPRKKLLYYILLKSTINDWLLKCSVTLIVDLIRNGRDQSHKPHYANKGLMYMRREKAQTSVQSRQKGSEKKT